MKFGRKLPREAPLIGSFGFTSNNIDSACWRRSLSLCFLFPPAGAPSLLLLVFFCRRSPSSGLLAVVTEPHPTPPPTVPTTQCQQAAADPGSVAGQQGEPLIRFNEPPSLIPSRDERLERLRLGLDGVFFSTFF